MFRLSVLCFPVQVKDFAAGRSLVQRSRTECLNKLRKVPCARRPKVLTRTVQPLINDDKILKN
jgi:hypothetical protein